MFAITLAIMYGFENLFLYFNTYVDWYYPFILTLLLIPMAVGIYFFISYGWDSPTKERREKLSLAVILYLVSVITIMLWSIIYM